MIINYNDLIKYTKKINCYLFYGPNEGLIEETIEKTIKPNFSKNVFFYSEIEILNNPDIFLENIFNESFFEKEKLIIIGQATDKLFNVIEKIDEKSLNQNKIIIKTGVLEKKSKLRNFFEKKENLIIVAFYEENYQSLLSMAQNFLRINKIKISNENLNFIIERSRNNRINLKNELKKIVLLSSTKKFISFEDIIKIINPSQNYQITDLTDCFLLNDKKKIFKIINENNFNDQDNLLIIKNFLFKLKRLKKIKKLLEQNKNKEDILSKIKPPIFWKDKKIVEQQLLRLSSNQISLIIKKINSLELIIKKNQLLSSSILNNFILGKSLC